MLDFWWDSYRRTGQSAATKLLWKKLMRMLTKGQRAVLIAYMGRSYPSRKDMILVMRNAISTMKGELLRDQGM